MARCDAPANANKLVSLRIGNLPEDMKTELVYKDFEVFGKIGDFYRPTNLQRGTPSRYAFVRYYNKDDADAAHLAMHGKMYGDCVITVEDANVQNSYFTQDTGFITNQMFDTPKVANDSFDSSMPRDHYPKKRKEALRQIPIDDQVTVRVDDLHHDITPERLEEIFSEFGEVTSIYYPMDLKSRKPKGFAFVRYGHYGPAQRAVESLHDTSISEGRNIQLSIIHSKTYLSQDESDTLRVAKFA